MLSTNNPAGRLHDILTRYEKARVENQGQTLRTIWSKALGADDPTAGMARVAGLIPAVVDAARAYEEDTDDGAPGKTVAAYAAQWAAPLFYSTVGSTQGLNGAAGEVQQVAMLALENLSSLLRLTRSEGRDVAESQRASLREELDRLIAQVREDEDLDPSLRLLVLQRLHDVATALDHYEVTGPGGLTAASERLAAAVAVGSYGKDEVRKRLQGVTDFASKIYVAVSFLGATGEAAIAISMTANYLGIGN